MKRRATASREAASIQQSRSIVPTKLPRIAVTVNAETHATLDKLSYLQRRPRSAIAADLLEEMTPALQRIATLLEAATKQRDKLPADTAAKLNELEAVLGGMAQLGLDRLAATLTPPATEREAAAVGRSRARRRGH